MSIRGYYYKILANLHSFGRTMYRNRLRVLAYHDVKDKEIFERQIDYLSKNYNIISLSTLRKHISEAIALPKNPVLITFDDGDRSVLECGLPVLESFQVPAVLFIITDLIGTKHDFWWDRVAKSMSRQKRTGAELIQELKHLKTVNNSQRLQELEKYEETSKDQLLIADLYSLEKAGVSIANHSATHPMFDRCTKSERKKELDKTGEFFGDLELGHYDVFAYPNGNYDENSEQLLIDNKVKLAFLFDHKINEQKINPLRVSRIRVNSDAPIPEFISKISGMHSMVFNRN